VRAPSIFALSVALSLALASPGFIPPAHADPAYSPDTVIAVFVRDNALAEAYKIRRPRGVCLGTPEGCPREPPPARARFDLLVSFQNNSDRLTQAAKDNLRQSFLLPKGLGATEPRVIDPSGAKSNRVEAHLTGE